MSARRHQWFWIVLCMALLLISISFWLARRNPTLDAATATSNQFLHAVQSSNINNSYKLLTKGAQYATGQSTFSTTVKTIGPVLNGKSHLISRNLNQTPNGDGALVIYDVYGTDNVIYSFKVSLILENGRWQVIDFKSDKKI